MSGFFCEKKRITWRKGVFYLPKTNKILDFYTQSKLVFPSFVCKITFDCTASPNGEGRTGFAWV